MANTNSKKLAKILYIDDEEWNLTAFKFMFHDEFEILTASDTHFAETLLDSHPDVDVVISDQRMPQESGVDFFDRMRARLFATERIILTGHSDIEAVIAAINQAGVYFYLRKPWQEDEVRLVLRNAIESVRMQRELLHHSETMRIIEENVTDVISRTDFNGRYVYMSPSILLVCGYTPSEMIGHSLTEFLHPDDATMRLDAQRQSVQTGPQKITYRFRHKDGHYRWIEASVQVISNDNQRSNELITVSRDISERKAAEQKIEYMAYHDVLTELPNRLLVRDRFKQAMTGTDLEKEKVALAFLDLDNFKTINDSLGHSVGDLLLQQVAKRLASCVREVDTISRQGGDEFLVVMPGLRHADAAASILDKLIRAMQQPFEIEGNELTTTISVGITICPDDGTDFDTLLKRADSAMYRAKGQGRNTYRFFDAHMNVEAVEHLRIQNSLRRGLERGEFVLHYQPQIELAHGSLIGAEALIRWQHPELGLLLPGRFISIAEESGLIVPIGDWVLREACRQAAAWSQGAGKNVVVAVNMSAVQFKRGSLERTVIEALEQSGLSPALLELELTESILIQDVEEVLATVHRLKALGVKLSIDDFGTGYSSLSYLKRFAVDKVKIDQSFTRDMNDDPDDKTIIHTIVQMSQNLSLRTIAEGVENEQMLTCLKDLNCDEAQGYYIARPMPIEQFKEYLLESQRKTAQTIAR